MINLERMTIAELAMQAPAQFKDRTAFALYSNGRIENRVSYAEFGTLSARFAALFQLLGVQAGSRLMLLSENRPEWPIVFFGAARAGLVNVPVLTDFSAEQINTIALHAGVSAVCVTEKTACKLTRPVETAINPALPLIYIDSVQNNSVRVSCQGREQRLSLPEPSQELYSANEDELSSIIYTSGTCGNSKGVMLSNRNLVFTALKSRSLVKIFPHDRLLSVLPLAHTYECTLGLLNAVMNGASTTYLDRPPSQSVLFPAIQAVRPTAMVTVPLFIEKIYRHGIAPKLLTQPLYRCPLTRPLALYVAGRKLRAMLGSSLRFFGIGGAPLDEATEAFLRKVHFPYAPGYGLTETAPLVAGTAPYRFPFRSAGSVLKGVDVRIAPLEGQAASKIPVGEIQVRGPNVMLGYYNDEQKTREAFTPDGWLKTGDIGSLDKKRHLSIRGRIKAMILGPSGENIYPEEIESLLSASHLVEEAVVYGDERGEIVALVVLSERAKTMLATVGEKLDELKIIVNKKLAAFSHIHRIEIRDKPFEKTATQKIRRLFV
ncbi:MAG: AMP-binding protein [Treponema sp.]|jgi:long-chain acyl-CoA synthetase|nr:AMP-binding protein [Treponema sp.]